MLILLAEIVLTVTAWRKGWNAMALAPLGVAIAIGWTVGGQAAHSGMSLGMVMLITGFFDLLAVAVLGGMTAYSPDQANALYKQFSGQPKIR